MGCVLHLQGQQRAGLELIPEVRQAVEGPCQKTYWADMIEQVPVWSLELPPDAVASLISHAQLRWWSRERVGQVYSADITSSIVQVNAVTTLASKSSSYTSAPGPA